MVSISNIYFVGKQVSDLDQQRIAAEQRIAQMKSEHVQLEERAKRAQMETDQVVFYLIFSFLDRTISNFAILFQGAREARAVAGGSAEGAVVAGSTNSRRARAPPEGKGPLCCRGAQDVVRIFFTIIFVLFWLKILMGTVDNI